MPHHVACCSPMKWVVLADNPCFSIVLKVDFFFEIEHDATQSLSSIKSDKLFLTELVEAGFDVALV